VAEQDGGGRAGPPPGLEQLLALQELDVRLDRLRHRRAHLDERAALEALTGRLEALDVEQRRVAEERSALLARESELESETAAVVARAAAIEDRARGGAASSYRDQEAMAQEVEALGRRRAELESLELSVLEQGEPLEAELARIAEARGRLEPELEAARSALAEAEAEVDAEAAGALARRRELAGIVPAELLAEYERLRARLGGVGVARLDRGRCSGCHLALPATEVDRLRHAPAGELAHCEQCGRILVP
jgi:predicted  nucleic acid-binding Zn-ribbon protein